MRPPSITGALLAATLTLSSLSHAQIESQTVNFASPPGWGIGSCQMSWGAGPNAVKLRGDDGMSDKSGDQFAVIDAGLWSPKGDSPYVRSIVSQVVWPIGTITADDVDKTVKFSGLFGWHGGEPMRVKDLIIGRASGFVSGDKGLAGLDDGRIFEFESVGEREWSEVTSTYTIKPEDVGRALSVGITVLSKQETADGLPVIATSDWKVTVTD